MKCFDCPRRCGINRPEIRTPEAKYGICGVPKKPIIARAGLHFWEEPVISGDKGSGAVFFSGCNLHCVYCQNYSISNAQAGNEITIKRLKEIYFELIAQGAHNINLVTPSHYIKAISQSLEGGLPVPVVYNSNGFDSLESLQSINSKIQIYLPDLKYSDNTLGEKYSTVNRYFENATAAIKEMYRQTGPYQLGTNGLLKSGVIIRHLVLPGLLDNSFQVIDWVSQNFKPGEVMFSLMHQYVPCGKASDSTYPELNRKLTIHEYEMVQDALFASSIEDGFIQQESSASQEFIPAFDGTGV